MIMFTYLALGALAGLLAGLFGIGGGVVVVPVLAIAFAWQGMPPEVLMHMAVATSLANIIVTSLSAIRTHQKKDAIRWEFARPIGFGMILGAFLGAQTAATISGDMLQGAFGIFVLYLSFKMLRLSQGGATKSLPGRNGLGLAGGVIGWASAIFGIGGGNLLVSWLANRGVIMQQAVATSAACGFVIGLVGAATNVLVGWNSALLPEYTLGYVYLPALAGIIVTSPLAATVGAKAAHRLPARRLQQLFALLLLVVGMHMVSQLF